MRILSLSLLLLLAACAGSTPRRADGSPAADGPDPAAQLQAELASQGIYPEYRPTRVTFVDHKSGVKVGLLNEATTEKSSYYSEMRRDAAYKVVPDLDMGVLMKQLEDFGLFQDAIPSGGRVRGARMTVQVDRGGQLYTLAYASKDAADRRQQVMDCSLAVQAIYNNHSSYQQIDNPQGAEIFREGQQVPEGSGGFRGLGGN